MVSDQPNQLKPLRVASVSFINAKPLIYGLERARGVTLSLEVPSKLLAGLENNSYDVALLPVIDFQRLPGLRILTAGGIGSDGPTLTVRIFSASPIEQIQTLACDPDSHTSVALARVILAERYGIQPKFAPLSDGGARREKGHATLLIGDKVICEEPVGLDHQLDLGLAWKELTGLPFVFAAWMARPSVDLRDLPDILERAKREGLAHVNEIVERDAVSRGWPADIALRYLTSNLKFEIGSRQLDAIRLFHQLAAKHGLIPSPPAPLVVA